MVNTKETKTHELETLDQIKERLLKKGQEIGHLDQKEIFDSIRHLDLSDIDIENLLEYFVDNDIDVIDDNEDSLDNIGGEVQDDSSVIDSDLFDDDDYLNEKDDDTDETETDVEKYDTSNPQVKDTLNLYLKDVGKVELLGDKEQEVARRCAEGDEEAKNLSQAQVEVIEKTVYSGNDKHEEQVDALARKVAKFLDIEERLKASLQKGNSKEKFLATILHDYNYYLMELI